MKEKIQKFFTGEIYEDRVTCAQYSHDASLFEVQPSLVVIPRSSDDIKNIVRFVRDEKKTNPSLSLTARAAGTDMTGGPLTESIVVDMLHFHRVIEEKEGTMTAEPGVWYRDFEKETLRKGYIMPSYPASRERCMIGGMVANDAGGEKTLMYGKTHEYVTHLKVILNNGEEYSITPLTRKELEEKKALYTFEGDIYRKLYMLFEEYYDVMHAAKPNVSKNSSGYNVWDVWNRETFDLTKLFVGSQGTLGLITETTFRLVKTKSASGMVVIFLKNFSHLTEIIHKILPLKPSSFESFDDHTFRLALKFFWGFMKLLAKNFLALVWAFLPEFFMIMRHGMPKLVLLLEFEEDTQEKINAKLSTCEEIIAQYHVPMRVARTREEAKKYWVIRRESFTLLRERVKQKQTAPFIDDIIVRPEILAEFLPKLSTILDRYGFVYTIAGHVGDGNFHVIPLMTLHNARERDIIIPAMEEVYALVFQYHGSMSAEHNDGIIRTPYIEEMFGKEIYKIFQTIKNIFDPENIFNPGKKVGGTKDAIFKYMKRS